MTEHRWSKFWWQDYESDDSLRLCSLAAQGLWMRMLCAMHRATPYGHMLVNGAVPTVRQMSIMLCATEREIAKLVPELEQAGVLSRTDAGAIYSRRMVRDKAMSEEGAANGRRGGNPALRQTAPKGLTPPLNPKPAAPLKLEAEAEAEEERTPLSGGSAQRAAAPPPRHANGSRLPQDWQPDEPGYDGATARTLERFRDYWTAQAGAKGRKSDWQATWRNWCRRDAEERASKPRPPLHQQTQAEQDRRILVAAGALKFDDPPLAPVLPLRIAQ